MSQNKIEFIPLKLSDKPLFEKYFRNSKFNNAEKNFSNLFMWRHTYKYEYAVVNDCLCVKGKLRRNNKAFCHFPYGSCKIQNPLSLLEEAFKDEGEELIIKPILPEMKECLERNVSSNLKIKEDRDSFDYIYTSNKLINLSGSKLRNKRRGIKKFTDKYDYTYETIDLNNLQEAKEFTINNIKDTNNDPEEIVAMEEMFNHFFELDIKGCIIRVADEVVGVSTGEELTPDTVIIHCERGNRDYEGIYNLLNQEFCKNQWADYKYINREEDLGIEGLRQAKLTYRPDILLTKYITKVKIED